MKSSKSSTPSFRDWALDHIRSIASEIQKSDPSLTREKALTKAAQTPEGREAHRYYSMPGSHLPALEFIGHLVAGHTHLTPEQVTKRDQVVDMRVRASGAVSKSSGGPEPDLLLPVNYGGQYDDAPGGLVGKSDAKTEYLNARHAQLKEGGGGGSGARGGRVEDPVTSGRRAPADSLPNPSDSIYAQIRADAIAANPAMSAEQAVSTYLTSSQGQAAHARWAAARQQEAQ